MASDRYYQQAFEGRGFGKTRNSRSYHRDDSYHNAVGGVSGFFTGLLSVALALGGTAAVVLAGASAAGFATNTYKCSVGNHKPSSSLCNSGELLIPVGAVSLAVGLTALAGAIQKNYNS